MRKLPLPIGIEFYKKIKEKPYYYVDKTLLIKELLDEGGKVNLFTRPRRFGKTLAWSTLRTFFEIETELDGTVTDNSHYFAGTKIMGAGEEYTANMGQYPVISCSLKSAKQPDFQTSYWSNTSSNSIVRELVDGADDTVKSELEELIAGGAIEKPVHEDITYGDVHRSQDNLWNFLFFTGYLKAISRRFEVNTIYLTLTIPNEEIRYIYQNTIREWFEERKKEYDPAPFYEGMRNCDCGKIEDFICSQLSGSISYYDSTESFYHGYLLGILGGIGGYKISSNREKGNGRPELVLEPHNPRQPVMIIEIKRARKFSEMDALCDEALRQIEEQNYAAELLDEGYQKIYKYGFCFCKKVCMVKSV